VMKLHEAGHSADIASRQEAEDVLRTSSSSGYDTPAFAARRRRRGTASTLGRPVVTEACVTL